jgi:hypothetical protein
MRSTVWMVVSMRGLRATVACHCSAVMTWRRPLAFMAVEKASKVQGTGPARAAAGAASRPAMTARRWRVMGSSVPYPTVPGKARVA